MAICKVFLKIAKHVGEVLRKHRQLLMIKKFKTNKYSFDLSIKNEHSQSGVIFYQGGI